MPTENEMGIILLSVYIINTILMFIYRFLTQKSKQVHQHGAQEWIVMVSLIFPVVGFLMSWGLWKMAMRRSSDGLFDEYKEYVQYNVTNLEPIRTEARISAEMSSLSDMLSNPSLEVRKQAILRYVSQDVTNKGKYLRTGLASGNSEIIHYAAATMNNLVAQFDRERNHILQQDITEVQRTNLLNDYYERIINSGVLQPQQQAKILENWLRLLHVSIHEQELAFVPQKQLAKVYQKQGKMVEAEEQFIYLLQQDPQNVEVYFDLISHYYSLNEWDKMRNVRKQMKEQLNEEQLNEQQNYLVSLWEGTPST